MISHSVIAAADDKRIGATAMACSPQNSSGPPDCDNGFLALLGCDGDFDLAFVDVKNRIRGVALCVERLIRSVMRYAPFGALLCEKAYDVKGCRI